LPTELFSFPIRYSPKLHTLQVYNFVLSLQTISAQSPRDSRTLCPASSAGNNQGRARGWEVMRRTRPTRSPTPVRRSSPLPLLSARGGRWEERPTARSPPAGIVVKAVVRVRFSGFWRLPRRATIEGWSEAAYASQW